jgi:hypothetical protein
MYHVCIMFVSCMHLSPSTTALHCIALLLQYVLGCEAQWVDGWVDKPAAGGASARWTNLLSVNE